jgi:hypothetical protein
VATEWGNHHRAEEGELTLKEGRAGGDLLGCRVTVLGWAALHHVQHEYILSRMPSEPKE